MIEGVKHLGNILSDEIYQWDDNIQVVEDELVIEISKTQEELNILDFLGLWPVLNNLHFIIGHSKARKRNNVSQILYWLRVKFAFLCFGIKTSLMEMLEYFNMLVMFKHIIWVDEYIIQIDYDTDIQKIRENVVYKLLEGYRSIGKTEGHYRLLKWSITCSKSSLPSLSAIQTKW